MRIVGGKHRGRPLKAPPGRDLRPTSDRAREALFNIIEHGLKGWPGDLQGAAVIDAFAGTGALGLEALSRGAAHATFIDVDAGAIGLCRANAAALREQSNTTVLKLDVARLPPPPLAAAAPCGVVFLDPPYGEGLAGPALAGLAARGWIAEGALAVTEIAVDEGFELPPGFLGLDERTYGAAKVVFLHWRT